MWLPLIGLLIGILVGLQLPFTVPLGFAKYMSVALLAAFDSVIGGIKAHLEGKYDNTIFVTGFIANTFFAGVLAYIGEQIGVELYYAAIFAFGVRLFENLAIIRRYVLKK
ncbi:MAG: small basic family protein [Bacillota bacterium]